MTNNNIIIKKRKSIYHTLNNRKISHIYSNELSI